MSRIRYEAAGFHVKGCLFTIQVTNRCSFSRPWTSFTMINPVLPLLFLKFQTAVSRSFLVMFFKSLQTSHPGPWLPWAQGDLWQHLLLICFNVIINAYITHWPSPYNPTRPKLNGRVTYSYLSGLSGTAGDIPASINSCQRHMET